MNPRKCERKLVRVGNYVMTGKVLGKGHFARVEEAVHNVLRAKVAVKIINVSEITDSYIRKNLKREACIMSKILHPNVVCLFEILEAETNYYLVTELGAGGDLCTYVKSQRHGRLDERKSRPLARQLVSAVAHLHDKGVVHRDLKMENILLDHTREKIKLVDFGLSNFYAPGELLETHCGSPEYAAPELYVSGKKYGPEVDVWSLGVVFYGMLIGKLPFQAFYKAGMTQQEKRKHLMEETRIGLTSKHTRALVECSHLFRNLLPKMLNPNSRDRISIRGLQLHSWIYGSRTVGFPLIDEDWQNSVITRISKFLQMPFLEVYSQILKSPYGPIGGIYNIEKLKHLINRLATCSTYHVFPRISISNSKANYHQPAQPTRPNTSNSRESGHIGTGDELKRRPRTSELRNVPDDLKATTNFDAEIKGAGDYLNKKGASSKMMSFINERFHRAFGLRKRADAQVPRRELERPNTVPTGSLPGKNLTMVIEEQEKLGETREQSLLKLSLNTHISSGHSSNNHSSRTNFIKYMCSQKSDKPKRPYTSPNKTMASYRLQGPIDIPVQQHSRGLATAPWKATACQGDDASDHYFSIAPSNKESLRSFKRFNFTTDSSSTYSPNNTAPPGVPRHTAARAALRRELAARSASKTQNYQKY